LALQGIDDAYGTMQQIDDIQPNSGRITRRALPGCAHSPHRDQPELVLQEVLNFLQDKA
jgi:pimeloyl-ACP methyl ester carboxylesterase